MRLCIPPLERSSATVECNGLGRVWLHFWLRAMGALNELDEDDEFIDLTLSGGADTLLLADIITEQQGEDAAAERQHLVDSEFLTQAFRGGKLADTVQGAGNERLLWVPKTATALHERLLLLAHEGAGHRGGEATFNRLSPAASRGWE